MKDAKFIIISFVVLICTLCLTIYLGYYLVTQPSHTEEIPCYDRYGNEIKEVTCEQIVLDSFALNAVYQVYNYCLPILFFGHLILILISGIGTGMIIKRTYFS